MAGETLKQLFLEQLFWVVALMLCVFYWANHYLYPVLLSLLALPTVAPYIPLLLTLSLGLIACGFLYLIKAWKLKQKKSLQLKAYLLTKQSLIMMGLSLTFGLVMLISAHFSASAMLYAGVWIPYLVILSVVALALMAYGAWRLWHGKPSAKAWRRVVRSSKLLLVWSCVFTLLSYLLSSDITPTLIAWIGVSPFSWLVLLVGSLSAALVMGSATYLFHRYGSNITLSINPFYLSVIGVQVVLPIVVEGSKVLIALITENLSGAVALTLSVAAPLGLTLLTLNVVYAVYRHFRPQLEPIKPDDSQQGYFEVEADGLGDEDDEPDLFDVAMPYELSFGAGSVQYKPDQVRGNGASASSERLDI